MDVVFVAAVVVTLDGNVRQNKSRSWESFEIVNQGRINLFDKKFDWNCFDMFEQLELGH